jgi:hypothetical protein
VGVGVGAGQVPQTGLGNVQEVAPALKFEGVEGIKVTHQLDKSWLKEDAPLNIFSIFKTLDTSQFPMF